MVISQNDAHVLQMKQLKSHVRHGDLGIMSISHIHVPFLPSALISLIVSLTLPSWSPVLGPRACSKVVGNSTQWIRHHSRSKICFMLNVFHGFSTLSNFAVIRVLHYFASTRGNIDSLCKLKYCEMPTYPLDKVIRPSNNRALVLSSLGAALI